MARRIIQTLTRNQEPNEIEVAFKYYSILSVLNELKLTTQEIQILAFTAVKGNINSISYRQEFVEMFNSSLGSVENTKGRLIKRGLLVKDEGRVKINPLITLDFTVPLTLKIFIQIDGTDTPE